MATLQAGLRIIMPRASQTTATAEAEAAARAKAKGRRRSAAIQRRLADQKVIGDALREHLGGPDHGIARAERLGLRVPKTVKELHTVLCAAATFDDASAESEAKSHSRRSSNASQRKHVDAIAANATASAYMAIAEAADGFAEIRAHRDNDVLSAWGLKVLIDEVHRRSGGKRSAVWKMTLREFAAVLDDPWVRMRKAEAGELFGEDVRTLKAKGVLRDEPGARERSRHCLVRRDALIGLKKRP